MQGLSWLMFAAGLLPFAAALRANRRTALRDALLWAAAAWLAWGSALANPGSGDLAYVVLCMTGGAGVAVLGARRPHVFAWNFVVLGLLGVMLLPLLEGMVIQVHSFNNERKIFLAAILVVGIGNYLPTRFAPVAVAVAGACTILYLQILDVARWTDGLLVPLLIGVAPWLGWLTARSPAEESFDGDWRRFRDRFGYVWGSRLRDQFNAAAKNANLPIRLHWWGKELLTDDAQPRLAEGRAILKALAKRFLEEAADEPLTVSEL